MTPETLTHVLLGAVAFLVGLIGYFVRRELNSITTRLEVLGTRSHRHAQFLTAIALKLDVEPPDIY